jgi:ABC-type nitrate/sulfonate/bicarbonate transport system permease component
VNRSAGTNLRVAAWPALRGWLFLGVLIVLWDAMARSDLVAGGHVFLPPAGAVFAAWWRMMVSGELPQAIWVTLRGFVLGLVLSGVIGIALGLWIARSRIVAALLAPIVEFLRPMPSVAVIPLAILFFGIGDGMKCFVATYGALWPVLLNTVYGVRAVDPRMIEVARVFQLGERRTLLSIIIPAAAPFIMTGLRIGSILTLGLVVTAELIASGSGIGYVIQSEQLAFKVPETFAGVATVMLLGMLLDGLLGLLEGRLMRWHAASSARSSR